MYIALLRGINVGGKNRVPMPELEECFRGLGATEVRSYIQSGNVVFRRSTVPERAEVEAALNASFGLNLPVVIRTGEEMARVEADNPYPEAEASQLQVFFLGDLPEATKVAGLDPQRSPGDRYQVFGREIYAHCPNGFGRTKLGIDYFERKLGTMATARNWNSVRTLRDWSRAGS